ncbi:MAG: C-GCAxxG-C-C family protein [Paludibacter sp.]|nr:C-GCAxxG-C-C family protein [Paludibacter sp.]
MRTTSEKFFHIKPENLNCAQSVLKGFHNELNIEQNEIDDFRAFGGGRAPEGLCGALFAAETLLAHRGKSSIRAEFAKQAGDITCFKIKKNAKTSCNQCVKIADELLAKKLEI